MTDMLCNKNRIVFYQVTGLRVMNIHCVGHSVQCRGLDTIITALDDTANILSFLS